MLQLLVKFPASESFGQLNLVAQGNSLLLLFEKLLRLFRILNLKVCIEHISDAIIILNLIKSTREDSS